MAPAPAPAPAPAKIGYDVLLKVAGTVPDVRRPAHPHREPQWSLTSEFVPPTETVMQQAARQRGTSEQSPQNPYYVPEAYLVDAVANEVSDEVAVTVATATATATATVVTDTWKERDVDRV